MTANDRSGGAKGPQKDRTGEQLTGTATLTSSSVSKETPAEFSVNTPDGELSVAPVNTAPDATKIPTIVNGAVAVFANTSTAADTIIRPDALGTTTLVQLRSSSAPTSFSWEIGLGPNQRLEKLSSDAIAVVEVPSTSPLEGSLGEGIESPEPSEAEAEHEGSGVSGEEAEIALEEGVSEETPLGKRPAAQQTTTPTVEPKSGELHPQDTKAQYETATSALIAAEEHVTGTMLMVIEPPTVLDAIGSTVTASLSIEDNTVTMTLTPGGGTTYPVTAETNIAAPSNQASAAKTHNIRYALDDPDPSVFTTFDTHLKTGPMHIGIARNVIPYTTKPTDPKLIKWLEAVKSAGLQPYITFGVSGKQYCVAGKACHQTSITAYEKAVKKMVLGLKKLHAKKPSTIPAVTIWGAWNEPDWHGGAPERKNPLRDNPKRAALFWKKARTILRQVGCSCTLVAGEFAAEDRYVGEYMTTIQRNHSFWAGKPHVWGLHDYHDLVNYYAKQRNEFAEGFLRRIRRVGAARVWFSEQGVALQDGNSLTKLSNSTPSEDVHRQREAAKDFLQLGSLHLPKELSNVEMVDYYLYHGPTKKAEEERHEPYAFDSALLPGTGIEENHHPAETPRQAYCILVLGLAGCPAKAQTHSAHVNTATSSTVALNVNPQGLITRYLIEYGTTLAYGNTTTTTALPNSEGEQSATVTLSGLSPCTTYHYQAKAENQANEEEKQPGIGGDKTLVTGGCVATAISTGEISSCAVDTGHDAWCWGSLVSTAEPVSEEVPSPVLEVQAEGVQQFVESSGVLCELLTTGHVKCWGANGFGQLGDGNTIRSETPQEVIGITNAKSLTFIELDGGQALCALLTTGGIKCWGDNQFGALGNGTTENSDIPVAVQGITSATNVSGGRDFACATLTSGEVKCWGSNEEDTLGDGGSWGTEEISDVPVKVSGITSATMVYSGWGTACAVLTGGSVECWGRGTGGVLGVEGLPYSNVPRPIGGISGAISVAVGSEFGCALFAEGYVECWGNGESGALGNGKSAFSEPSFTFSATPSRVLALTDATAIAAGGAHACVLRTGGKLACWGDNGSGEVGDGKLGAPVTIPTPVEHFE